MKHNSPGRPAGAINSTNEHARDEVANKFRCTKGFKKVVAMLLEAGQYKSQADIYHEALHLLASRKVIDIEHYDYWVKRIQ